MVNRSFDNCPFCGVRVKDAFGEAGICTHCHKYLHPEWYALSEDMFGKEHELEYFSTSFEERKQKLAEEKEAKEKLSSGFNSEVEEFLKKFK